jgi:alkaline phosphatase D
VRDPDHKLRSLNRREFLRLAAGAGAAAVIVSTGWPDGYAFAAGPGGTSTLGTGTVPEQIHLTWGADSSTEMTVSWVSPQPQTTPQLVLTPPTGQGSPVTYSGTQVTPLNYTDTLSNETVYAYHVPLSGLAPGQTYTYAIEDAGAPSPVSFTSQFTTAQQGRFAYSFSSFGDLATPGAGASYTMADGSTIQSTTYSESQWNAYNAVGEIENQAPLFHLMNGDLAYADKEAVPVPSGTTPPSGYSYQPAPEVWRDYGLNTQRSAANRPWMPCIGNHEAELGNGPNGYASFNTRYLVPSNSSSTFDGNYYSFTVGSVLFISLDANDVCYQGGAGYNVLLSSYTAANSTTFPAYAAEYNREYTGALGPANPNGTVTPGSNAQTLWLEQTLANARTAAGTIDWIVVQMHQCACSSSTDNGCDLGIRQAWLPLFFQYGVDLVLNGHDHDYERTYPLNGFNTTSGTGTWKGGTVYSDGNGGTTVVPANNTGVLNTLTPVPVPGYTSSSTSFNTQAGTVFMTLGGGGTNKRDNTYETGGKALVTTFTQVRTGGTANGLAAGTKPTPDSIETQSWSALTDAGTNPYGVAVFSVNPGTPGGNTSMAVSYYHGPTQTNSGTNLPAPSYSTAAFDSFTLVRPRSDSPEANLPEFADPVLAIAGAAAVAGGAVYLQQRRHRKSSSRKPSEPVEV